jgi:hypothetical protein
MLGYCEVVALQACLRRVAGSSNPTRAWPGRVSGQARFLIPRAPDLIHNRLQSLRTPTLTSYLARSSLGMRATIHTVLLAFAAAASLAPATGSRPSGTSCHADRFRPAEFTNWMLRAVEEAGPGGACHFYPNALHRSMARHVRHSLQLTAPAESTYVGAASWTHA